MNSLLESIGPEVVGLARGVEKRVWEVKEKLLFGNWCESNIILGPGESRDYQGPYSRDMVPSACRFWEEFLDAGFGLTWREMLSAKGSQAAFSAHALMAMSREVDRDPGNMIYCIDTQPQADVMAERFVNFLKSMESLDDLISITPENDLKGRHVKIKRINAWFTGANSVGELAGKPGVVFIMADEADLHPTPKNDARTLDLLRDRAKATIGMKFAGFSKPSVVTGQIWKPVMAGSRHRDFVPCPHCGLMQYLKMERVRYLHLVDKFGDLDLAKVRKKAEYECEGCGRGIEERHKQEMLLDGGEVRPTNYKEKTLDDGSTEMVPAWEEKVMSVLHNDLYALWEGSKWGDLAAEKHLAKRDPMKLRAFVNGRLGEAWKQGASRRVQIEDLEDLKGSYLRGGIALKNPAAVYCLYDTQDDCWKGTLMVFDHKGSGFIVDWGLFLSWDEVVAFALRGVCIREAGDDGPEIRLAADAVLVDEGGHRSLEVRKNCLPLSPLFTPIKGRGGVQTLNMGNIAEREYGVNKTQVQEKEDGMVDDERINVLVYNDDGYRWMLYNTLIVDRKKAKPDDPRLWMPEDVDKNYQDEFLHEFRVKKGGVWGWDTDGLNDFGDTVKEGFIAWDYFGAFR